VARCARAGDRRRRDRGDAGRSGEALLTSNEVHMNQNDTTCQASPADEMLRGVMAWLLFLAICGAVLVARPALAQALNTAVNEQVVMVPKKTGLFSIDLETTIFKPDGDGPFPIALINHGKAFGDPKFQARYRPSAARYFMSRGYVVVVPMRRGFSKSTGSYIGGGCNVESNGVAQAEDVKDVLEYMSAQPYADKNQILVAGQSHGGWTTLAFGTLNYPGVKGLVNFAGGLKQEGCAGWESTLARAAGNYGENTRAPSLWFYGDNDSYFSISTHSDMFKRYSGAGAPARLVSFGVFGSDAHAMFGSQDGMRIWQPEMTAFLKQIGLPSEVLPAFAKYQTAPASTPVSDVPPTSPKPNAASSN
jgi:dienelactone hydrolase